MKHLHWSAIFLFVLLAQAMTSAGAQARLPFQAYGSGLRAGAVVEAVRNETALAKTTVDAEGNWVLQIPPEPISDGEVVGFRVDGRPAKETIVFRSARFVRPPGLALTVDGQPAATGSPAGASGASGQGTATPGATTGSSSSTTAIVAAIGAVMLGLAGAAIWWRRRAAQRPG